jgi:flagellar biosynthesis protein
MNESEPPQAGGARAAPGTALVARAPPVRQFGRQQSAVALAYSGEQAAPRVVARGRGLVAQAIIERAHQHGVYVHESTELVALLMQLDLDQRIPPQLYRAVAELLAWVYRLERNGFLHTAAITDRDPGR